MIPTHLMKHKIGKTMKEKWKKKKKREMGQAEGQMLI